MRFAIQISHLVFLRKRRVAAVFIGAFKTERMENRLKQTTATTKTLNLRSIEEARQMELAYNLISWVSKTVGS